MTAHIVDSVSNVNEMLEKLGGHVLVGRVGPGQFQGDRKHIEAIHAHPGRAIGLFQVIAGG